MRYSKLVYINEMLSTLIEASEYLSETDKSNDTYTELSSSGLEMITTIIEELNRKPRDIKNGRIFNIINDIKKDFENEVTDATPEKISYLKRILPTDITYQIRVMICAELGEKWDSIESVYEYMRDDPRFDPVVVLAPIFRHVEYSDGTSKTETIYRDYLTPMGVPFVEYKDYDIEHDCPDVSVTCQPYESCTVPMFWAVNLAKYSKLVYTSYFIPIDITNSELSIYKYAWMIAALSDSHVKQHKKKDPSVGDKMLITGLPKTDPIIRAINNEVEIPSAWIDIIKGKKVFLWSTRYAYGSSSLKYSRKLLEWLGKHKDCILIWRRHPMTDIVTQLYYDKKTYQEYCDIKKMLESSKYVIVDNETSFIPGFKVCDALLTDPSSLLIQFLLFDKPVLRINERPYYGTEYDIIDLSFSKQVYDVEGIFEFMDRIIDGTDLDKESRKNALENHYTFTDGKCGSRLSNSIWDKLHLEDKLL